MPSNFNLSPMRSKPKSKDPRKQRRKEFYVPTPVQAKPAPLPDQRPSPKRKGNLRRQLLECFIGGIGFAGGVLTVALIITYLFGNLIR